MRAALALLVVLGALLPAAALAQTTTFSAATTCSSEIAVSGGGLTLGAPTSSTNDVNYCIANTAKYSGKWYFEFTVTQQTSNYVLYFGPGVANNGASQPVVGGTPLSWNANTGSWYPRDAAFLELTGTGSGLTWNGSNPLAQANVPVGTTAGIAVDLDSDPPQIWATPDVTATNGYNGGPEWNASTTASPLVPGTGIPSSGGTGLQFLLPGQGYFPAFVDWVNGNTTGGGTFNFGASAFKGTAPTGYSAWNSAGGGAPVPGPLNPMTINVANAPGWQASTTYVQGDRVVAGPAWNGSAYTSGQPLYLWALTGGYGGASGTSATAFNACPNPAGYGGGLLGNYPTQWLNATHVSDGALTWTCLTPVDYTTFTAMAVDSATVWAPSTQYHEFDYILDGENAYEETTATNPCTSAATGSGPSGGGGTDGTCGWQLMGTVPYSSEANRLPHETTYVSGGVTEINVEWNTIVNLWYGGRAAPVYQDGADGETDPMLLANHIDYIAEYTPDCYHGDLTSAGVQLNGCAGTLAGWLITLQPAPGDGFANNMASGITPFGYPNSAYGVEFYSNLAVTNAPPFPGPALTLSDSDVNVFGLQILSTQGPALAGALTGALEMGLAGNGHNNAEYLNGDMLYAGGSLGVATFDASAAVTNSTLVYAGTATGCFGVWAKFNPALANDTLIGPGSRIADCAPVITLAGGSTYGDVVMYNNALFGWSNPLAYGTETGTYTAPVIVGANNATDIPSNYAAGAEFAFGGNASPNYYPYALSGISQYGVSAAAQFVNPAAGPGMNLALLPSGSLYGGGAAFSYAFGQNDVQTLAPGADIFGNARPQGTRYDIGAYQVSLGCPSPLGTGCR